MNTVCGIVLASGKGRRFDPSGHSNKLWARMADGHRVLEKSTATMHAALGNVYVVVSPEERESVLSRLPLATLVINPEAASGMASSIRLGLAATPKNAAVIIGLGDMPFVEQGTIAQLAQALGDDPDRIVAPCYQGRRGQPVGFGVNHRTALGQLKGDTGARQLLSESTVFLIETKDSGILRDIDSPSDLA